MTIINHGGYSRGKMSLAIKHRSKNKNPIGVYGDGGVIYLFYKSDEENIIIEKSTDGKNFTIFKEKVQIFISGVPFPLSDVNSLNISRIFDNYFLSFSTKTGEKIRSYAAKGKDFDSFTFIAEITDVTGEGVLVPNYHYDGEYVFYYGRGDIEATFSKDFFDWRKGKNTVIKTHEDFFQRNPLMPGSTFLTGEGILLFYFVIKSKNGLNHFEVKAVVLDRENPLKILRTIDDVVWESPDEWTKEDVSPLGIVKLRENFLSFWKSSDGIYSILHPHPLVDNGIKHFPELLLKKLRHNPIIKPLVENMWESKATMNPAAIYEKEKVHIIYRAIGEDDVSVLGYAVSSDGINIDSRSKDPIYTPTQPFESSGPYRGPNRPIGNFTSGGGCWGGVEDPRITKIDDKIYMTYVAYDGWSPPRVALTSIDAVDFNNQNWNWSKPVLISKPGVVDKNACIMPEKINGKYAIFHRVFPNILIDFVDNLDFDGSTFLKGEHKIKPTKTSWDSRKIGVGPPPIKTDDGWLMLYQAVGERDPGRYKIGAMLLETKDPTRVLSRSAEPILSPDEWYENAGHKAGVAYPCGAVNVKGNLIIYYGGADTVVCAATAQMDEFISNLKKHKEQKLSPSLILN